jgi:hypothetical protein
MARSETSRKSGRIETQSSTAPFERLKQAVDFAAGTGFRGTAVDFAAGAGAF